MMIGGGVNRKYEPSAVERAEKYSSGSAVEVSGSSLGQAAGPLVILIAITAGFLTFSGNACEEGSVYLAQEGSAIARGCAAQEAARAGEGPENDISRYSRHP